MYDHHVRSFRDSPLSTHYASGDLWKFMWWDVTDYLHEKWNVQFWEVPFYLCNAPYKISVSLLLVVSIQRRWFLLIVGAMIEWWKVKTMDLFNAGVTRVYLCRKLLHSGLTRFLCPTNQTPIWPCLEFSFLNLVHFICKLDTCLFCFLEKIFA